MPVFNAQSHRKLRSCLWSTATGLVEPLAAVLAVLALAPYITDATLDYSLLYVGGCVIVPLSSLDFLMINVNLPRQARDRHTTNAPKNNCDRCIRRVMVTVSLRELLPEAWSLHPQAALGGMALGAFIMIVSLYVFGS